MGYPTLLHNVYGSNSKRHTAFIAGKKDVLLCFEQHRLPVAGQELLADFFFFFFRQNCFIIRL